MPVDMREILNKTIADHASAQKKVKTAFRLRSANLLLKRPMDICLSLAGLIIFFPMVFGIGLLIMISSPGAVLYKSERVGKDKKKFQMYKFRTMIVHNPRQLLTQYGIDAEFENKFKLKDDPRIINGGRFLRRTGLDELPQLFNILKGEMSLVGPRPILLEELSRNIADERFLVRPGLTGLWQIRGKNETTYEQKIMLDCYYVRHRTLFMDLKILWQTIPAILRGKGFF